MSEDVVAVTVREIRAELEDDYVGLWVIPWELHRQLPGADAAEIRRLAERTIRELVRSGVRVGEIFGVPDFTPWEGDDVVERLLAAWDELGREPDLYEIAWFDLPEAHRALQHRPDRADRAGQNGDEPG